MREMQRFFGFEEPRVIYMWQHGQCLPSVDNLYALSVLLGVPMNEILVSYGAPVNTVNREQQAPACCPPIFYGVFPTALEEAGEEDGYDPFAVPGRDSGLRPDRTGAGRPRGAA